MHKNISILSLSLLLSYASFDINSGNHKQLSYNLLNATRKNSTSIAELLIYKGADVNTVDKDSPPGHSWTPLYFALLNENAPLVKLLISKGANVNLKDDDGWTPIIQAVHNNSLEFVKLLVEAGADVNSQTNEGLTPLRIAEQRNAHDIANYLISKGAIEATE